MSDSGGAPAAKGGSTQLVKGMAVVMLIYGAYALIHVVQWASRGYLPEILRYVLLSAGWLSAAVGLFRSKSWGRWAGASAAGFDVAARLLSVGTPGISSDWTSAMIYCIFPLLIGWFLLRPEFKAAPEGAPSPTISPAPVEQAPQPDSAPERLDSAG